MSVVVVSGQPSLLELLRVFTTAIWFVFAANSILAAIPVYLTPQASPDSFVKANESTSSKFVVVVALKITHLQIRRYKCVGERAAYSTATRMVL